MSKVNYSIVGESVNDGLISVQSTVESFGLNHVTSKDIVSFYKAFSSLAAYDTGLLPVDGSGILSIRSAGQHTQFAYQHKPGLYRINWAPTEGASNAAVYYVAQPYRIIICDIYQGNLLGARTFYTPYPITSPSQPLYHVNLPNINCKGYRGNAVGWICLYQNEDWTGLPLNEKIVRFIERCSGVETYNDGNMSETDGTRFYQENNKPDYLWDPVSWQKKSEQEGFEWTLNPDLWIQVLVTNMDHQSKHDLTGVPLTFADALIGDYNAYYHDPYPTKPINSVIRPDKEISQSEVLSYFVSAYKSSALHHLNDTFNSSLKAREEKGSSVFKGSSLTNSVENHNDVPTSLCYECESQCSEDSMVCVGDYSVCPSCLSENYCYIESCDEYYHKEDEIIYYHNGNYYHLDYDTVEFCAQCSHFYVGQEIEENIYSFPDGTGACRKCVDDFAEHLGIVTDNCIACGTVVLVEEEYMTYTHMFKSAYVDLETSEYKLKDNFLCEDCVKQYFICPCGITKPSNLQGIDFNPCGKVSFNYDNGNIVEVNSCCSSCLGPAYFEEETSMFNADFVPVNVKQFNDFQKDLHNSHLPYTKNLYKGFTLHPPF